MSHPQWQWNPARVDEKMVSPVALRRWLSHSQWQWTPARVGEKMATSVAAQKASEEYLVAVKAEASLTSVGKKMAALLTAK